MAEVHFLRQFGQVLHPDTTEVQAHALRLPGGIIDDLALQSPGSAQARRQALPERSPGRLRL